jgi:branched-chain amino acid aminotransferase
MKIYYNGDIINKEEVGEIFEPGFLFGWGAFEPLRVYKGNIPFLPQHLERFAKALELLGIGNIELAWEKTIKDLLAANSLEDAYLRITGYKKRKGIGLLIYVDKFSYYTPETYQIGFSAIISSYKRCPESICSKVKSLSYLANRTSWLEAQKLNKDEALILNSQDFLAGGSRSNLFIVKQGKILTPSLDQGAFCGITRSVIISIARELGLDTEEVKLKVGDIFSCDEAFITSALMEVMPLVELEGKAIADSKPKSITLKLMEHYRARLN